MEMHKFLLACSLFFVASLAHAQEASDPQGIIPRSSGQAPNDAVGVHLAPGFRATAGSGLQSVYNNNFYLTPSNAKSAFGFILTPDVLILRDTAKLKYQIGAGLEAAKYTNVEIGPSTYLDGNIHGHLDWAALTRHNFTADFSTQYGHDQFGAFRTEAGFDPSEGLDKWLETNVHGTYQFGTPGALINLQTKAGWTGRRYETNRPLTELLDYRIWTVGETAFFNVSSKTALLAEVVYSDIGYAITGTPSRDSTETQYRAGIHWAATGTTSGDFRIGQLRRNFDDPSRSSQGLLDWTATVTWAPLVYSVITVQSGLQTEQSYLSNVDLIQNRYASINWTHAFSNYFVTKLAYSHLNSEFLGISRVDKIDTVSMEANYLATKRFIGTAGAAYSKRDSNEAGRDYNDTSIYIGVRYSR
jgi:hypothetical protein